MTMTARTIVDAAVRHARLGPDRQVDTRVLDDGAAEVAACTSEGFIRLLRVSATVAGHPRLEDCTDPDRRRLAVLPETQAVEAVADWINGAPLPAEEPPAEPGAEVAGLYDRVWAAAVEACASDAAAGDWPVASDDADAIVLAGPRESRLSVRARVDDAGQLTGAAWQGRRADGSAVHGHGGTDAALAAAAQWAAGLDDEPVITPAELRARREATGASQADLARLLGASQSVISHWESGSRAPRDPAEVAAAVAELEALADDLYQQALADGRASGRLVVWDSNQKYWAAVPTAPGSAPPRSCSAWPQPAPPTHSPRPAPPCAWSPDCRQWRPTSPPTTGAGSEPSA